MVRTSDNALFGAECDRAAQGNRNIEPANFRALHPAFVPSGDLFPNQMHKDSVMGRRSFTVSLASYGPIPLDGQPGSVLGEERLVYRDLQISEILEVVKDRALHALLDHATSPKTTLRSVANRRQPWQNRAFPTLDASRPRVPARCRS